MDVWQTRFNELAAKYRGAQTDLKRYTRVAQEHASKNQQLQEAYLKLKTELSRMQAQASESKKVRGRLEGDLKSHERRYKALADEFQQRRRAEKEAFLDQTEKLRESAEVEAQRAGLLQKKHAAEAESWRNEMAMAQEVRSKEQRAYELKMAEMQAAADKDARVLREERQALADELKEWRAKHQKLQAVVQLSEQDSRLALCEKEIEELLANKKQLAADLDRASRERDEAVVGLESARLTALKERKTLEGRVAAAKSEAEASRRAYDRVNQENTALHSKAASLGARVVALEREVNAKHNEARRMGNELKSVAAVAEQRVAEVQRVAAQRCDQLESAVAGKDKEIEALEKEADRLRAELGFAQRSAQTALKTSEEKLNEARQQARKEAQALKERFAEVKERAARRVTAAEDQLRARQLSQDERAQELVQARARGAKLQDQVTRLTASSDQSLKEAQGVATELRETQQELELLQIRYRELKDKENKTATGAQDLKTTNEGLRRQLADARSRVDDTRRAMLARAVKQKDVMTKQSSTATQLKAQVQQLKAAVDKLNKDKKKLKKMVVVLRAHAKQAVVGKDQMQKANEVVLDTKNMELQVLKKQLIEAERQRDELKRRRVSEASTLLQMDGPGE